jgi:hypothetical protein
MRILNFDEFSLCYSTKKETCRCRQHKSGLLGVAYARESGLIGVAYTEDSTTFFSQRKLTGVGYTGELNGVGYTSKSRLPGVAYTIESQPSRPAYVLKGTIPEKADCEC